MKKILFALLLLPFYSHAQLDIAANDGIAFFKPITNTSFKLPQNIFDANIFYRVRHAKIGLGYSTTTAKLQGNGDAYNSLPVYHYKMSQSINTIYLSARYESNIGRSSFYEGVSAGYVEGKTIIHQSEVYTAPIATTDEKTWGISLGAYIGYSYDLWNDLCVDAQVGANYITTVTPTTIAATLLYFPVTAGIRNNIHFHKKAKQETPATQVIKGM